MPSNWDNDIDGEWEPPLINNPKCAQVSGCGKWKPPLIDNPKFKGKCMLKLYFVQFKLKHASHSCLSCLKIHRETKTY